MSGASAVPKTAARRATSSSVDGVSGGAPKRRAVSSKPAPTNASSMLQALWSQLWMYRAFSGKRSTRQAEMVTVRATRAASVSPSRARSSGSRGVTDP